MTSILDTLSQSPSALDVKTGFQSGSYDLEVSLMECLDILSNYGITETHHIMTESIMIFLHD